MFAHLLSAQTIINVPENYPTIQQALNVANEGDTILVQSGTYKENIIWPNKNGIILIGSSKETTIINGSNISSSLIINPMNAVIDNSTVIKNLSIISGGNSINGGGIMIVNCSPLLENLLINNNSAKKGGGIYLKNSSATIIFCLISNNNAISSGGDIGEGGGVFVTGGTPQLVNINITDNTSYRGAGISLADGNVQIDSSKIVSNVAEQNGGGIYLAGNSNCEISNSTIKDNRAPNLGGGICNYGGLCTIDNNILDNNFSYNGAGIYDSFSSNKTIVKNSIIINHTGAVLGAAILSDHNLEVHNSTLAYNSANAKANPNSEGGGICGKFHSNIVLDKVAFIGNSSLKSGGALSVSETSNLTIENCTFSNNSSPNGDAIYVNSLGNYSITNNNFIKNGYALFNNDNTIYVDATNNYWGNPTGAFNQNNNPTGLGDSTNYFVNIVPWLTNPNLTAPPSPPLNISANNITNSSITLNWQNIQIGDLAGYKVYFSTDSVSYLYANYIDVKKDTTYTLSNLSTGQKYYIAITSYNNGGNESWFSKQIIVTALTLPNPPVLISPQNNFSFPDTVKALFAWHLVDYATLYHFQLSANEKFDSLFVENDNLADSIYSYEGKLLTRKYFWRVRAKNVLGFSQWSEAFSFSIERTTGINNEEKTIPICFSLGQNYPNPFNPNTIISFGIPKRSSVKIIVYNILGQIVETLLNEQKESGFYKILFNAPNLSSGVYICSLKAGDYFASIKMIFQK